MNNLKWFGYRVLTLLYIPFNIFRYDCMTSCESCNLIVYTPDMDTIKERIFSECT